METYLGDVRSAGLLCSNGEDVMVTDETGQGMRHVGGRKYIDTPGARQHLKCVANLDVNGISKDLFVQFVGDGCMVDKARDKPDLVWQTYIIA